ncbi:MAG: protein-L-isoaspartate(D-aspartate) O-methyltransferase [Candidatus Aenigmarchaeota archaeon]|nr:protein-L-isoaspartate(D-aspartate) O-methyltransferase [Candidatus Aenigmarchaeota archaeon]
MVKKNLALEDLIEHMKNSGTLRSKRIEKALREVPRHGFIPKNNEMAAYDDVPVSIGHRQTISQPSTVVMMTEALEIRKGYKILEIGTGSGWQTAILSKLVGDTGKVYSIERIPELVKMARKNLKKFKNVKVIKGDGTEGLEKEAPFHRVIVTAAAPQMLVELKKQLKVGGKLIIPVGNRFVQEMLVINKIGEDNFEESKMGTFVFVPLIGKHGFTTS